MEKAKTVRRFCPDCQNLVRSKYIKLCPKCGKAMVAIDPSNEKA